MGNEEKPLVVVKHNKIALIFLWVVTILWTIVSVFGVIIPVLSSGDFNATWIAHSRPNKNVELFFLALLCVPTAPFMLCFLKNAGAIFFYTDRIEVIPYILHSKKVFFYEDIQVTVKNSRVVNITRKNIPDWFHPLKRYKAEYLQHFPFWPSCHQCESR